MQKPLRWGVSMFTKDTPPWNENGLSSFRDCPLFESLDSNCVNETIFPRHFLVVVVVVAVFINIGIIESVNKNSISSSRQLSRIAGLDNGNSSEVLCFHLHFFSLFFLWKKFSSVFDYFNPICHDVSKMLNSVNEFKLGLKLNFFSQYHPQEIENLQWICTSSSIRKKAKNSSTHCRILFKYRNMPNAF